MTKDRLAALRAVFTTLNNKIINTNLIQKKKKKIQAQDDNDDDVEVNMDTTVFMEEFFNQVEDIRNNVENIQKFVNEVKKLHSTILAAPTTDDSEQ